MFVTIKTVLATVIIVGTATFALADDGTDMNIDTSRSGFATQAFKSSKVSLSQGYAKAVDQAGASHDNGGN
jgi:hypothetical protein